MHTHFRRYLVVLLLILATYGLSLGLRLQGSPAPRLPSAATLTAASPWLVSVEYEPGDLGMAYQQWLLRDQSGREALLFVGATGRPQTMLRWTGELGYQGDGYVVTEKRITSITVGDGRRLPAQEALIQHLEDRRLLEYAVIGPGGRIVAQSTDLIPEMAWAGLQGRSADYYMVRVSVPASGGEQRSRSLAGDLLSTVLPRLAALTRSQ
jgi:hypothetical protein